MEKQIDIFGKKVDVLISDAAVAALLQRDKPLVVEMELYFSCLIRKKVRFKEDMEGDLVKVMEQLSVRFRPVMTKECGTDYEGDEPPLTDFPIEKPEAFVPRWLKINFKKDQWLGEFGF